MDMRYWYPAKDTDPQYVKDVRALIEENAQLREQLRDLERLYEEATRHIGVDW